MSRRRASATALKLSEVVAARDMRELYADMGICQRLDPRPSSETLGDVERRPLGPPRFRVGFTLEALLARRRPILAAGVLLIALAQPVAAQRSAVAPDSTQAQIRGVIRAFYLHLQNQNWEALSAYVLSPKLLERRGAPENLELVTKGRTRTRGSSHSAPAPPTCGSNSSPMIEEAAILVDGDWAEVSVPRCSGTSPGVDQFRMLHFEERWRFIYTDLFQGPETLDTAER